MATCTFWIDGKQYKAEEGTNLVDAAKENALHLIQSSSGPFLILSNDKPTSYKPLSRQRSAPTTAAAHAHGVRALPHRGPHAAPDRRAARARAAFTV